MKALSIKQPWLYCITDLGKRVENRTWRPHHHWIGKTIALHASKRTDTKAGFEWSSSLSGVNLFEVESFPAGVIVATASIQEVATQSLDNWFVGPYGWVLADVRKLDVPVPCRGHLGLWSVPGGVLDLMRLQDV